MASVNESLTTPPLPALADASKQIRLISILQTAEDEDVNITVHVHNLQDVVSEYIAVSYTWGDECRPRSITVDGSFVLVRHNCWYALQQMKRYKSNRPYWIDSLCIDQRSHEEKTLQVRQMGPIYSGAYEVAACVGESMMEDCGFLDQMKACDGDTAAISLNTDSWTAPLRAFASRSYFSRQWTIQECILSQRLTIFVGFDSFPWSALKPYLGINRKKQTERRDFFQTNRQCSPKTLTDLDDDIENYVVLESSRLPLDLAETILRYRNRKCSKPEDRLYSVMSLVPYAIRGRIGLDYDKPPTTILMDFVGAYRKLRVKNTADTNWLMFTNMLPPSLPYYGWGAHDDALWRSPQTIKAAPNEPVGSLLDMLKAIGVMLEAFGEVHGFLTSLKSTLTSGSVIADVIENWAKNKPLHWSQRGHISIDGGNHCGWDRIQADQLRDQENIPIQSRLRSWTTRDGVIEDVVTYPVLALPCGHDLDPGTECAKRLRSSTKHKIFCHTRERSGTDNFLDSCHYAVPECTQVNDFVLSLEELDDADRDYSLHIVCRSSQTDLNQCKVIGFALRGDSMFGGRIGGPSPYISFSPETLLALAYVRTRPDDLGIPLNVARSNSFVDASVPAT